MPDSLPLPADVALRLVGAFYILAAALTIRAGATNLLLNRAVSAISGKVSKEDLVERQRIVFLTGMALLTGAGGILLAARLDLALWVFLANAAVYALYLFVVAPRFFDPSDEPDEKGRRQTRNAFFVYLAATVIVAAAWWSSALRPFADEHPAVLVVCVAAFAGMAIYAWRSIRLVRGVGAAALAGAASGAVEPEHDLPERVVLTPSWQGSGLVDAGSGASVRIPAGFLPPELEERIVAWLDLFRELADPDDPTRRKLRDPADLVKIEAEGRAIREALSAHFGPDRVAFEAEARPCAGVTEFSAMQVAATFESDPVWDVGVRVRGYEYSCSTHHIGISWRLAEDLLAWARDYDASFADGDPGGRRTWSPEEAAEHDRRGLALARRLAGEFAATGRGDIPVSYQAEGAEPVRVDA
ncbi:MAG TPA: hypothetical protein GX405_05095 [Rhizobiales bacterium]|nr:hypothetical protein [Hyphomicrobiales bacterium]